jgi:hypothetical protein
VRSLLRRLWRLVRGYRLRLEPYGSRTWVLTVESWTQTKSLVLTADDMARLYQRLSCWTGDRTYPVLSRRWSWFGYRLEIPGALRRAALDALSRQLDLP